MYEKRILSVMTSLPLMHPSFLSLQQKLLVWIRSSVVFSKPFTERWRMVSGALIVLCPWFFFPFFIASVPLGLSNLTRTAGIPLPQAVGSKTAVYVGCFTREYDSVVSRDPEVELKYLATGTGTSMLSNRLSWFYDF